MKLLSRASTFLPGMFGQGRLAILLTVGFGFLGWTPSGFGALPDLVPAALQIPSGITNIPYPLVGISWTVTNQGASPASGYYDSLYISTNATLDNTAFQVGTWFIGNSVAPGSSYSATNTLQLPLGFRGNYYALFKTDSYNSVPESNETNNLMVAPFHFEPVPPDLAPLSALVPSSLTVPPNPTLTIIWSVTNLGPAGATGNWSDAIYFSTNGAWTPDAPLLGVFVNPGSVPAGQSYWQTNFVRVPLTTNGRYYLILYADVNNNLYETNLSNNSLVVPVNFNIQPPDLAALPLQVPTNVLSQPNPALTVAWAVTNLGPGLAQGFWTDSLFLSTNNSLDTLNDPAVSTFYEYGPVPSGTSYAGTNVVQLRVTRSGTYYLFFQTDVANPLLESQLGNNLTSVPISFTILNPDLAPVSFQAPAAVTGPPNPTLTMSWGVTNLGTGSTTGSWSDAVYLSPSATLDSNSVALSSSFEYTPLDSGDDYWRTNNISVPVTQSGSYYLIFTTDYANSLDEPNTNNNTVVRPISFTIQPPNLAPTALLFTNPLTVPPNPTIQLIWSVTNSGVGLATGSWIDELYFSSNPQLDVSDPQLSTSYESGPIAPGAAYWRTNNVSVPITQSGTYYFIFVVNHNASSKIFESDYSDNTLAVPVTFNIQPPDLVPVTANLPGTVTGPPYPPLTLVWGITNQGIGPAAAAWNDALYLSTSPFLTQTTPLVVQAYDYGPIPPGGMLWVTNSVRLPVTTGGTYYWIAQANVNQQLFESNFDNNLAVTPVQISIQPPDLSPIGLQAPSVLTGPPYPNVAIAWGVTNQGTGAAVGNGFWFDHLYVSTNPTWDASAADVFSLAEQGPFAPGDSYWRTNTVRLPISSNGTYYLFFKANALGDLVESDYNNNTAQLAFTFNAQDPDLAPVGVQAPATVSGPPYPSLTYVWGVTNQGAGDAIVYNTPWLDTVALSTNNFWDPSEPQLFWSYQAGPVPAGGVYWQTNRLRVPVTQSGQYYLIFNPDANLALIESDFSNNTVAKPITFDIQPPDLAPLALQVPATLTGPPNPSLAVVWGVTNQGTGPAIGFDTWNDTLFLSTVPEPTPQAIIVANSYEPGPIAPGQTYWRTNTVRLPVTQSGTYYLIFTADDGNPLLESNPSNNVVVVPISLNILPPDLAPVPPALATITGPPNPAFTLVWGVTNQGAGPAVAPPAWIEQVFFSKHPRLEYPNTTLSTSFQSDPIAPGAVAWLTNAVWAPVVQSGTYYLIFSVNSDIYNLLDESNYSNNLAVVPVSFDIQPPDLAPIALSLPTHITTTPNPVVTFIWGITNQGPGAATTPFTSPNWSDVLYLSTNSTLDQTAQSLTTASPSVAVAPGGSYWVTNSITLPITQSGTFFFTIQANANGALYESDYTNNTLTVPVTFQILPPDLAPLALQVSSVLTSAPNPRLSVVWGVTNQGPGAAQGSWNDVLFLSTNNTFDASAVQINYAGQKGPIPAGGVYWQTNLLQIPIVQSGKYFLFLKANAGNYLFESDYNNNLLAIPLTFTILPPDLAPIALEVPSHVTGPPNPTLNLAWGVTNQGVGPAIPSGFWVDHIYFSTTSNLNQGYSQPLLTQYQQQLVPPGGAYWHAQWVQVPVVSSGTYYLIFSTDDENAIYESNENNNTVAVPVTFTIQPSDLLPISLQAPATVAGSPYPSLQLTWGVTNQGSGPAQAPWQDSIFLSSRPVLDPNAVLITSRGEPGPLPAGSSYWRSETLTAPVTNSGKFFLIFQADANNSLVESSTDNNFLAVPVTFNISAPDLAPIVLQAPAQVSGAPYPTLSLVWGVTNQGPGDLLAGTAYWLDQLYFSTNASLDTSSAVALTSTYEAGPLLAGGTYWRTNLVRVPVTEDGTYYLFLDVNATSYQAAIESNYGNNLAVAPVQFHVSPPDLAPISFSAGVGSPAMPYPLVTFVWGVTNQGSGPAQGSPTPWNVSVEVTKTNLADGTGAYVSSWSWSQTNLLLPGQSLWSTNSANLPIESGTYALTFTIDPGDLLYESNTNNNSLTTLLSVNISPSDIAAIYFSGSTSVISAFNPTLTLVWGVTNQSGNPAQSPYWSDQLYLSTNSVFDNSAFWLGAWPQTNLVPPGATYWRTNTISLPTLQPGPYNLILVLDAANSLGEANLSNNVAVLPVTVVWPPPPDLAPVYFETVTNVVGPPNPVLTFVWAVTNQGPGTAQGPRAWSDAVYISASPVLDGAEIYSTGSYETNPVAPGAVYWRTNTASVPITLSGTYYAIFKADADFGLVESDYGNNTAVLPLHVTIAPADLAPIAFYAPAAVTGAPNPSVTLVVGVTNQGVGAALAASDALYISSTAAVDASAKLIAFWPRSNSIPPGGAYWLTNTVRLPLGDGGSYYLVFQADASDALLESDLLNNVAVTPIRLQLLLQPDLALEDIQFPSVVNGPANPTVQLSWYAVNQGLGPAVGPWSDTVLLSTNPFISPILLASVPENLTLPVGGSYSRTNTLVLPLQQSGTFFVSFQLNDQGDLFELDYGNNGRFIPFNFNLTSSTPVALAGGQFQPDGAFLLGVSGSNGVAYTLQTSTDLAHWVRLMDFICTNPPTWLLDHAAPQFRQRFYRVAPYAGTGPAPFRLDLASAQPWAGSGCQLKLDGPLLTSYRIQVSTNLIDWATLTNFSDIVLAPVDFKDTSLSGNTPRFYRAVSP